MTEHEDGPLTDPGVQVATSPRAWRVFAPEDRVEWNPVGDEWRPATVHGVAGLGDGTISYLIILDEDGQGLHVRPEHLRPVSVSTVVELELHRERGARERTGPMVQVDLDRLTSRARALAEVVAASPAGALVLVVLESTRTVREVLSDAQWAIPEELNRWYTPEELDAPHRGTWSAWDGYPVGSGMDPYEYLERQARRLPIGYFPVGRDTRRQLSG